MTVRLTGKNGIGKECLVSPEDYEMLSKYTWWVKIDGRTPHVQYVRTRYEGKELYMHRMVIGDKPGHFVDHINRNTLDNRRENLRHVTPLMSVLNRGVSKVRKDRGVSREGKDTSCYGYTKKGIKYQAQVNYGGKSYYLGLFQTAEQAHQAYLNKRNELSTLS